MFAASISDPESSGITPERRGGAQLGRACRTRRKRGTRRNGHWRRARLSPGREHGAHATTRSAGVSTGLHAAIYRENIPGVVIADQAARGLIGHRSAHIAAQHGLTGELDGVGAAVVLNQFRLAFDGLVNAVALAAVVSQFPGLAGDLLGFRTF